MKPFAFYGRVSTEDQQDPKTSRNWQLARSQSLIEPHAGEVVAEFFDIGLSRSLPWKRRPQATALLQALREPDRGSDAVVIGEPARAFYGNQFSLTFPVFVQYGVGLWVPEVGGAVDPGSDAHDLVMSLYGGMSKGERNRIKIRVRSAMAAQAATEGRFLGGRPPHGYRLIASARTPIRARPAAGQRPHGLEADSSAAPVVVRIFRAYVPGKGLYGIAEGLTRDVIPCVRARPGPQPSPRRRRVVEVGGADHPAQPPLHGPGGVEPSAPGGGPDRRRRCRARPLDQSSAGILSVTGSGLPRPSEPLISPELLPKRSGRRARASSGPSTASRARRTGPMRCVGCCCAACAAGGCRARGTAARRTTAAAIPTRTVWRTESNTPEESTSARTRSYRTWTPGSRLFDPANLDATVAALTASDGDDTAPAEIERCRRTLAHCEQVLAR